MLSDEQIAVMSLDERRDLFQRLATASGEISQPERRLVGPREVQVVVMVVASVILILSVASWSC